MINIAKRTCYILICNIAYEDVLIKT